MSEAVLRTVGEMLQAMTPAMREILTAEELAVTTITAVREPPEAREPERHVVPPFDQWPRVEDATLLDVRILVRVRTFTDSVGIWAGGGRETAAELHERFRSPAGLRRLQHLRLGTVASVSRPAPDGEEHGAPPVSPASSTEVPCGGVEPEEAARWLRAVRPVSADQARRLPASMADRLRTADRCLSDSPAGPRRLREML